MQFPLYAVLFFIRCGTPLVICAIYDVISCAFVVICSTFVVICCGFAAICGAYVIICSDFSIIPTFCHSISTVLSLYRVVYALYGVQTILPRVHFALFAVLSSLYRTGVMIYPQCKARVSDPSSSQPCRIGHVGKCSNSLRVRDHGRSNSYETTVQGSRRLQCGLERCRFCGFCVVLLPFTYSFLIHMMDAISQPHPLNFNTPFS